MFYFDPMYLLFALPAMLLAIYAQFKVQGAYKKYSRVRSQNGMTGADAARVLIPANGLSIRTEIIRGNLTDHYDPRRKIMRISEGTARNPSVASVGVVAHELGHAMQDKTNYPLLRLRSGIVPLVNISSWAGYIRAPHPSRRVGRQQAGAQNAQGQQPGHGPRDQRCQGRALRRQPHLRGGPCPDTLPIALLRLRRPGYGRFFTPTIIAQSLLGPILPKQRLPKFLPSTCEPTGRNEAIRHRRAPTSQKLRKSRLRTQVVCVQRLPKSSPNTCEPICRNEPIRTRTAPTPQELRKSGHRTKQFAT